MSTNTTIPLPGAVSRYFEATNRFDAPAAAACFTSDAVVRDEGHEHTGTDSIQSWISQTGEKYQPHATVINAGESDNKLSLTVRVAGQFPGSPVELKFEFLLREDKIAELVIQ